MVKLRVIITHSLTKDPTSNCRDDPEIGCGMIWAWHRWTWNLFSLWHSRDLSALLRCLLLTVLTVSRRHRRSADSGIWQEIPLDVERYYVEQVSWTTRPDIGTYLMTHIMINDPCPWGKCRCQAPKWHQAAAVWERRRHQRRGQQLRGVLWARPPT